MGNQFKNGTIYAMETIKGMDPRVRFVADPFFFDKDTIIVEVFADRPREKWLGAIDIRRPDEPVYLGDVLRADLEEYSFPFVFRYLNESYIVPERTDNRSGVNETGNANLVWLYKLRIANSNDDSIRPYPTAELVRSFGIEGVDPVVFEFNYLWFLIVSRNRKLYLYFSRNPVRDEWQQHPISPLPVGTNHARMAGRPLRLNGKLFLFMQERFPNYGWSTRVYEVTSLSKETFSAYEAYWSPITCAQYNKKWNHDGMHHVDFDMSTNRAIVDGHRIRQGWTIALVQNVSWGRPIVPMTTRSWFGRWSRALQVACRSRKSVLGKQLRQFKKRNG